MATIATAGSLDRTGKTITTYIVFDLAAELSRLEHGEVIELITDDLKPIVSDITTWCASVGHRLIASGPTPAGHRFMIEKGTTPPTRSSLAMVLSPAGLEELLSPLGFALAAALENIDVHLYIQGPAVRVLKRGYQPKLKGLFRPFTRFAAAGMAKSGHIAAQEKLRQLRSLGASIYMCAPSMDHFKVDENELIFDDLPLIEYLSFMPIMAQADAQLYI